MIRNLLIRALLLLQATVACTLIHWPGDAFAQGGAPRFDHFTTGFELTGAHRDAPCESCHIDATFKGTPRECVGCHSPNSRVRATAKSATHVMSTQFCADCHTTVAWRPASRFDHSQVTGSCATCHNGVQATGKHPGHVQTSQDCGVCHRTTAWVPAGFVHDGITGNCFSCHNGAAATGKGPRHITSGNDCETCHATTSWIPARFSHAGITGNCSSCHNGTAATGKGSQHIPVGNDCESCHTTSTWRPATFTHAGITASCSRCHNGTTATGKNPTHIQSSSNCEACHATTAWRPATRVDHAEVIAIPGNSAVQIRHGDTDVVDGDDQISGNCERVVRHHCTVALTWRRYSPGQYVHPGAGIWIVRGYWTGGIRDDIGHRGRGAHARGPVARRIEGLLRK